MKTCTKLEQNLHKPKLAYQSKLVADVTDVAETFAEILKPFETFADTIVSHLIDLIAELFLMLRLWILLNLVLFLILKLSICNLTIFL